MQNVITIYRVSRARYLIGVATLLTIAVVLARQPFAFARIGSVAFVVGAVCSLPRRFVQIDLQTRVVTAGFRLAGPLNLTRRRIPLSAVVGVLVWFQHNRVYSVADGSGAFQNSDWQVELVLKDDDYLLVHEVGTTRPGEKAARDLAAALATRLGLPLRIVDRPSEVRPGSGSW